MIVEKNNDSFIIILFNNNKNKNKNNNQNMYPYFHNLFSWLCINIVRRK